jgi:hypothetical protein
MLGFPLSHADRDAAPLVVWEGSHQIMRDSFRAAFTRVADADPSTVDVTEVYQNARKRIFDTCPRIVVHGAPGSAYLLHRLVLHGIAPWAEGARSAPEGRLVAYFRPPMPGGARAWADA